MDTFGGNYEELNQYQMECKLILYSDNHYLNIADQF